MAIFTTVEEADARDVIHELALGGHVPPGLLGRLEYVGWCGEYKDLRFVPDAIPGEVLLVDDDAGWCGPISGSDGFPLRLGMAGQTTSCRGYGKSWNDCSRVPCSVMGDLSLRLRRSPARQETAKDDPVIGLANQSKRGAGRAIAPRAIHGAAVDGRGGGRGDSARFQPAQATVGELSPRRYGTFLPREGKQGESRNQPGRWTRAYRDQAVYRA